MRLAPSPMAMKKRVRPIATTGRSFRSAASRDNAAVAAWARKCAPAPPAAAVWTTPTSPSAALESRSRKSASPKPGSRRRCWTCAHRSEEHTSELESRFDLVCRLLLEKKKQTLYSTRYRVELYLIDCVL